MERIKLNPRSCFELGIVSGIVSGRPTANEFKHYLGCFEEWLADALEDGILSKYEEELCGEVFADMEMLLVYLQNEDKVMIQETKERIDSNIFNGIMSQF